MDCPKCGYAMSAFDTECPRCKRMAEQQLEQDTASRQTQPVDSPAEQAPQPSHNTPWANASFILGLCVFLTAGLTGPFALWAGVRSNRQRENSRTATNGIVLGIIGCCFIFLTVFGALENSKRVAVERERQERQEREAARAEQQRRWEATRAEQQRRSEAARAEQQRAKQKSRNTFAYVDSFQSPAKGAGHKTDAQRKASWDRMFGGQWVRWEGEVVEVSGRGATCTISMRCSPTTMTSDTDFDLDRATAVSLHKGDRLRIEGRLRDHSMFGYRLTDVRVVANFGQRQ